MSTLDTTQTALALVCVVDALACAIDPSGSVLRHAHRHLSDGLLLAEQMGVSNNDAALIIGEVVDMLSESEPFMKARSIS